MLTCTDVISLHCVPSFLPRFEHEIWQFVCLFISTFNYQRHLFARIDNSIIPSLPILKSYISHHHNMFPQGTSHDYTLKIEQGKEINCSPSSPMCVFIVDKSFVKIELKLNRSYLVGREGATGLLLVVEALTDMLYCHSR